MRTRRPKIIRDVGFDFHWDPKKVWKLNVPTTEMDIKKLIWHFKIPFWEKKDTSDWNLTPWNVLRRAEGSEEHQRRVRKADLKHPIDIMRNKNRWLILDGLHRLVKAYALGLKRVNVRKIPRTKIPKIVK